MANPQKENGNTQLANEIWDALTGAGLNGTEAALILHVIRKTYGWHKKFDRISLTQFEKHLGKSRPAVCRAIKFLVVNKLLLVNETLLGNEYGLNKDYTKWLVNKPLLVNKMKRASKQNDTRVVNKTLHTKETITKETIQKKYIPINKLVKTFNHDFERIRLTTVELDKLHKKFRTELKNNLVDFENAIGAKNYGYKSHYRAMLKWYDKPKTPEFYEKEMEKLSYPVFCNKYSQKLADKYSSV